jgi:hypothetical protein
MNLPKAPAKYEQVDQDRLRNALELEITQLQQQASGWQANTGTATRTAFDTATVTLPQLAERVKALVDDLVLRVKS